MKDLTPALASQLGLSIDKGVLVVYAAPDSPAAKAGIKDNDVITSFGSRNVTEASRLIKLMWQYNVGDTVSITFWRGFPIDNLTEILIYSHYGNISA